PGEGMVSREGHPYTPEKGFGRSDLRDLETPADKDVVVDRADIAVDASTRPALRLGQLEPMIGRLDRVAHRQLVERLAAATAGSGVVDPIRHRFPAPAAAGAVALTAGAARAPAHSGTSPRPSRPGPARQVAPRPRR